MAPSTACFMCRFALAHRPVPVKRPQAWLGLRNFSRQARERPSRMVLSDQVHRPPASRDERRPRRSSLDGPFAGMNRRSVPSHLRRTSRSSDARPDDRGEGSERSDRGGRGERGARFADRRRGDRQDDRKALNMHRALAIVSYGKRASIKDRMRHFESFDQFDMLPSVKTAVLDEVFKGMVDIKPTPVQRLAIPALLGQSSPDQPKTRSTEMRSFLLAAETGSGKTLAYLLPAIDALKVDEANDEDVKAYKERQLKYNTGDKSKKPFDEPHPNMARPRVIVLVPSAELAQQVTRVSKTLSHVVKFKTEMLSSDLKPQQIQRNLYGPKGLDVVVATPHLLASIAESDPNILARVTHLIVDEADSLFDRSFSSVTTSIIERAMPSMQQLVCCSATIPRKLNNYLAATWPKMVRITTPNLHAIPRRVQLGVVDVSKDPYRNNKNLACADSIYAIGRETSAHEGPVRGEVEVRRIIVFVNEREKTEEVAEYLRTKGIDAQALHRDAKEKRHGELLDTFTSSKPLRVTVPQTPGRRRSLDNVKVLVVTDLASRGIDTLAVRYVILYDVPHTTIDFIHRLGRAGRMGRRGRGIVLVGNDDRRDVVSEVKSSMYMGQALI
ncbi:ATP-dependent RNA helicase mrh-4 [Hirsutella minnesotensis 3608]|nr:ATP-dependent RNA helicase mrh-4 [Hirsutella minnesotensis 3608]